MNKNRKQSAENAAQGCMMIIKGVAGIMFFGGILGLIILVFASC
jgi:hypothetical protein